MLIVSTRRQRIATRPSSRGPEKSAQIQLTCRQSASGVTAICSDSYSPCAAAISRASRSPPAGGRWPGRILRFSLSVQSFPPGTDHAQVAQQLEREIRRLSALSGY